MLYFLITLSCAFVILSLLLFFTWRNNSSPTPTSSKMKEALLEHLPSLEKGMIVELGSGWGTLLFPLADKYSHCKIIGYENSPIPYVVSSLLNQSPNLDIVRKDFFEQSLRDADLVICYLFPKGMKKLKKKLEKELRQGAHVVSHTHEIPGWSPKKTIPVEGSNLYLYEFG